LRYGADDLGPLSNVFANLYAVHRWDSLSSVNSLGLRYYSRLGNLFFGFDSALNFGTTREISAAYQHITNDPVVDQNILQGGARVTVRYDRPIYSLYLEGDYASGSSDPTSRATLGNFVWGQDTNVGLLLFKQILAFQTARAAAAGTELLKRLGATSFPTESIATKGAMTNAMVLFPQVDLHPYKNFLIRTGVMFAWTSAPLIDPVASLQRRRSVNIEDDLVNFAGGRPGRYYGTELDVRLQYRFLDHFLFDLEGAVLFPGDALENADGVAVRSVLVQGRTTFFL
ncbi:MAG TPA: alginate export family protein, partial [Polyangiaceae bacterium]